MKPATAILFFSRSAHAEAVEKVYGSGRDQHIAAALIERTRRTVRHTGFPVFEVDERQQRGQSFGQRLAHAVSRVYDAGYERVIIIGNDCPTLTPAHLRRAAAALAAGQQVIGTDHRGGAYLIGLQRQQFEACAFAELAWQTERLTQELLPLLGEVTVFGQLRDINRTSDLRADWHLLRTRLAELSWLIRAGLRIFSTACVWRDRPVLRRRGGRAPPVAA